MELHLVVGGGLVQLRVRLTGDRIHRQGPGVFLRGLGGEGHADGKARRTGLPELLQLLGGEFCQFIGGERLVQRPDILDHGGLAGGKRGTGGLGIFRGRSVCGEGRSVVGVSGGGFAEQLPELKAQDQDQQGDGGNQKPAGECLVVFLRGHGGHPPF